MFLQRSRKNSSGQNLQWKNSDGDFAQWERDLEEQKLELRCALKNGAHRFKRQADLHSIAA
ncbi:hypothetical protein SAMN05428977_11121 [Nitrosomonas sp. Nm166]|nr:hypothetical protein SAMN05428977_11121 [Nitrosomonas sp. Nm166]